MLYAADFFQKQQGFLKKTTRTQLRGAYFFILYCAIAVQLLGINLP